MTRHRIAQIGENRNPKSPETRPQTRRFLQIRLLQLRRSATPFNGLAVLHGRLFDISQGGKAAQRSLYRHRGECAPSFREVHQFSRLSEISYPAGHRLQGASGQRDKRAYRGPPEQSDVAHNSERGQNLLSVALRTARLPVSKI